MPPRRWRDCRFGARVSQMCIERPKLAIAAAENSQIKLTLVTRKRQARFFASDRRY